MGVIRRLRFVIAASAMLAASAVCAQVDKVYRIASFAPSTQEGFAVRDVFRGAMRELGYVEGRNIIYESRDVGADKARQREAAAELVALKPDVLVAWESEAKAMREHTTTIPIVLNGGLDPVGSGLARTLRRSGTNVTGVVQLNDQLPEKHIQILSEILPKLTRIGLLFDKGAGGCRRVEESARRAAQKLGKTLVTYEVANRSQIEAAFAKMERERPDAMLPCPSPMLYNHRALLFSEGLRLRVPWTSFIVVNVPLGVLFAHSSSRYEDMRKAATYVDRVLKGANPAELPLEQPSKFELVINLQTARALGIAVPQSVLLRADRVIE